MIEENKFRKPVSIFKGAPFWSINDLLTEDKVRKEVQNLNRAGYGGAFFHAREGLVTPFLSKEWFDAFRAAVEEAGKNDMFIWIYDELWWPSGFAGGLVPFSSSKNRAKALVMMVDTRNYKGEDVIASFECVTDENGIPRGFKRVTGEEADSEKLYLTFMKYVAPVGEAWYNSSCYVDLLDYETVRQFLNLAYKPYVDLFKNDIGRTVPGVFTDEPNFSSSRPPPRQAMPPRGPRIPPFSVPWTDGLPEKFKQLNGYDLTDHLPKLFFDLDDYMKVRYDFWRTVTILFLESFSKQIYEWCDKNNLKFTGHYLSEDDLLGQTIRIGAAMPHYEYQHVPGIDHLGMHVWRSLLTAKQVSSAANQLGKERVLCEVYGCTGNYPTFEDRKWIGDWLITMGVNLMCHHLVPYSMRGRRKRDYGLNFHWGQPWWDYNEYIEDHFSRLCYVLSSGRRVVNVLVIHSIGSAWASYSPLNDSTVKILDSQLKGLLMSLLKLHIDFDLGDEMLMEKHASVEGSRLRVGNAFYDIVVVPPCLTLAGSTVKLLKKFKDSGGELVFVKPLPSLIDGKPSVELAELINRCTVKEDYSTKSLSDVLPDRCKTLKIDGDEEGNLLYHLRRGDSGDMFLFVFNASRDKAVNARIGLPGSFSIKLLDTLSGSASEFEGYVENGWTYLEHVFEPVSSLLLAFSPGKPRSMLVKPRERACTLIPLSSDWNVKRVDPNVLVLDYCRYRTGGEWSEKMPLCRARKQIVAEGVGTRFTLKFDFELKTTPLGKRIKLAMETPGLFKIRINGKDALWRDEGHWVDDCLRVMSVSEYLKEGSNEIELEGLVGIEPEMENIFLIGEFGVELSSGKNPVIVEEPTRVETGDLTKQGYPFYVGSFELRNEFQYGEDPGSKTVVLRLDGLKASLALVYINGQEAGRVFMHPFTLDVTRLVRKGVNELKVRIIGTLRNAFGPLHYAGGDPLYIGPETFEDERHWTDEYVLKPFGLEKAEIVIYEKNL
ncbi:MAG: glycosyl hydrolase [Thermoproteota archaeon]